MLRGEPLSLVTLVSGKVRIVLALSAQVASVKKTYRSVNKTSVIPTKYCAEGPLCLSVCLSVQPFLWMASRKKLQLFESWMITLLNICRCASEVLYIIRLSNRLSAVHFDAAFRNRDYRESSGLITLEYYMPKVSGGGLCKKFCKSISQSIA